MRLFAADPRDAWKDELQGLAAEFEHLRMEDRQRLDRAVKYREEIEASRDFRRQMLQSVPNADYGRQRMSGTNQTLKRHSFRFPLAQALTVKHAYRIAGRLPDAFVDKRDESELESWRSEVMEKIWWGVTYESDGEAQFGDAAWDASQIGSAGFEVYLDPTKQLQVPCYRAFDTGSCVVVPGLKDPHEFQRLYRWWTVPLSSFLMSFKGKEFRDIEIRLGDVEPIEGVNSVTIVECDDPNRRIRFALSAKDGVKAVGLGEWNHGYGFVGSTIIPNIGPYRRIWGWSDYDFVREITAYIQQVFAQHADILRAVANGAYVLKGTKLQAAQVKQLLEVGGVIPAGREGELNPVQPPEIPAFTDGHVALAMDLFERLGFAPPAAWGAIGAQSGSDRGLQLAPLYELTSMKQKNWNAGLSKLASMIYRIVEQIDAPSSTFSGVEARGKKRTTFSILVGNDVPPVNGSQLSDGSFTELPRSPKEVFRGEYRARFEFADRIDYDDPAYVASEINKFAQAVQSLETTLENLGVQAPQDEIARIKREAEEMPWVRQGMIALIEQQLGQDQQGANDGSQNLPTGAEAMNDALDTMTQNGTSALDADAGFGALPGGGVGVPYGGA